MVILLFNIIFILEKLSSQELVLKVPKKKPSQPIIDPYLKNHLLKSHTQFTIAQKFNLTPYLDKPSYLFTKAKYKCEFELSLLKKYILSEWRILKAPPANPRT